MESSATQDLRFRQKRQHLNFSSETSYFLPKLQIMAAQIFRNNTIFGCESSPISRNVRSSVNQLVSQSAN